MLRRLLATLFVAILPLAPSLEAGLWSNVKEFLGIKENPNPPKIKILIAHDLDGVNFEVKGKYSLYDPNTQEHISTRFIGKSKLMQGLRGGLKWGEEFPGLYQIKVEPEDDVTRIYINGTEYSGSMYVYDIGGGISIVNEVDIELYVQAVMANLFKQPMSDEALRALAIAVRTNAYVQATNPKNTYWALDAQRVGFDGEASLGKKNDAVVAAEETKYMILSKTGNYERKATPFLVQWTPIVPGKANDEQPSVSLISQEEAENMAKSGMHAAQILGKAFPGSTIMLMSYSEAK